MKSDLLIGSLFAKKYRIEKRIGKGGMGTVYKAYHIFMKRYVALKVLDVACDPESEHVKRFQREAKVSAFKHPNVPEVFDAGATDSNTFYIAMQYLEGRSLYELMQQEGILSIRRTVEIAVTVCNVLHTFYRDYKGIHRDIKPSNIFLRNKDDCTEEVMVLDFGVAKCLSDNPMLVEQLTTPGTPIGTPEYMSPEQFEGQKIDNRTDIYSLATTVFLMATGRLPFTCKGLVPLMCHHTTKEPPRPSRICPDLSAEVEEVILRGLSKNPNDRHATALEFAVDLCRAAGFNTKKTGKLSLIDNRVWSGQERRRSQRIFTNHKLIAFYQEGENLSKQEAILVDCSSDGASLLLDTWPNFNTEEPISLWVTSQVEKRAVKFLVKWVSVQEHSFLGLERITSNENLAV